MKNLVFDFQNKSLLLLSTGLIYQCYLIVRLITELIINRNFGSEGILDEVEKFYKFNGFQFEIGVIVILIHYGNLSYEKYKDLQNKMNDPESKKSEKFKEFQKKFTPETFVRSLIISLIILLFFAVIFFWQFNSMFGILPFFADVNRSIISDKSLLYPGILFVLITAFQLYFQKDATVKLYKIRVAMLARNFKILFVLIIACSLFVGIFFESANFKTGSVLAFNLYLLYNEIKIYQKLKIQPLEGNSFKN